jgi:hypothetical protein
MAQICAEEEGEEEREKKREKKREREKQRANCTERRAIEKTRSAATRSGALEDRAHGIPQRRRANA